MHLWRTLYCTKIGYNGPKISFLTNFEKIRIQKKLAEKILHYLRHDSSLGLRHEKKFEHENYVID